MFEVVYEYGEIGELKLPSKVYAVDPKDNTFLIVDGWGKFHWVDMTRCTLKCMWEADHGSLGPLDCAAAIEDSNDIPERPTPEGEAALKLAEDIIAVLTKGRGLVRGGIRYVSAKGTDA